MLLRLNPDVIDKTGLEAPFTKYGCLHLFPQFSHLVS